VVALGANYAIAEDCQYRGMLWRIERIWPNDPYAVRVPGFGAVKEPDTSCEPEPTHKLTVTVSGQGRIVSAPAGIDCPGSCEASFPRGTELRLYAAPEAGSTFSQWEGAICPDGSADTPVDVIIENASTCGATFAMGGEHRLTVRVEGGGRVTSDLPGIDCGLDCIESYPSYVDVTLEGHPDLGYRFERITGHDDCEDRNLVMDGVRSCVALFGALPAPAAPSGFMASAAPIVVQLRWDGVNGPVVRYTLERANASGTFVPISSDIAGTASTFADITAVANTTYTYRLTAHNHSGASTPVTATVTTGVLPPQPQRGWYELGKELSVTTEGPQSPSIAVDANGLPTVAYVETTANIGRLFVRRFDGTTWQTLGGSSLNPTSATSASNPSLVLGADANPRVAFSQGDGQQQNIYVAAFDGQDWGHLGPPGVPLNQTSGSNAVRPSLARVGNDRYTVAWIENGAVKVKTYAAATGAWDSYGMDGPISANASAVELAIAPNNEPVVAWRENVNSLSELRVSRGFDMRFIGIVTGPVPATDLRDFGLIVETDQPGSPLVAFGQGVQPWSIRARRHDGTDWLQLSDVLTGVQAPLQAMAMHRSSINQGVAVTYQARGNESDLVIYRRDNTEWIPTGTTYPLKTSPQLSLAMATNLSPVVAVVENDAGTFRLRVFRYFP
jgi:hypothetical protein